MNRSSKIVEWLLDYTPVHTWIFYNVTPTEPGVISVNSVQNERYLDEFIDGSRRVEFIFAISLMKEYDTGTSPNNLEAMHEFELLQNWIEEQVSLGNLPDFGENIEIEKMEVLDTTPSMMVSEEESIAKYQGQFKVTYLEKGE